jgi:hypothetical protein
MSSRKMQDKTVQRMKRKEMDDFIESDEESDNGSEEYSYESEVETEWLEYHESEYFDANVPKNQWTRKKVDGTWYEFYNRGDGTLDFDDPGKGYPACRKKEDVNILKQPGFPNIPSLQTAKGDNSGHFRAANQMTGRKGAASPSGWTWHHHKDIGRMQLLDRKVHAAFKHCGGKSIWGTV